MQRLLFHLDLDADECLLHYKGMVQNVQVIVHDGRRVRFPANLLRRHLRHEGVHGRFELLIDSQNKAVALNRLA